MRKLPVESGWEVLDKVGKSDGAVFRAEVKQKPSGADRTCHWRVVRFNPQHTGHMVNTVRQDKEKSREAAKQKALAALREVSGQ